MLPDQLLDVDDPDLLLPGDMPARINAQLNRAGKASIPEGDGHGRTDGEPDFSQPGGPLCRSFAECKQHHGEDF